MQSLYRAAIFDMDGTIVDNMRFHSEVWLELAAQLGTPVTSEQFEREFAGKKNEEILPLLSKRPLSVEESARIAADKEALYRKAYAPHLAPLAGLTDLLSLLREHGVPCAVATAAPLENRDFILDGLSLREQFSAVVGAESVTHGKPHPDIFLHAAQALNTPPADCLVFEDAINGVLAARAAGMDVVGVLTTTPANILREAGARWTIDDFRDLPGELRRALGI